MDYFETFLEENNEYKEKYEQLTYEERQQLYEVSKAVEKIAQGFLAVIKAYAEQAVKMCERVIFLYPNKRVVYLAKYSKKERVRKKNVRRIAKDIQRKEEIRKWT